MTNTQMIHEAFLISGGGLAALTGMRRYDEQDAFWRWIWTQVETAQWEPIHYVEFILQRHAEYCESLR